MNSPLNMQQDGRCLYLTLSSPENLLNKALIEALNACLDHAESHEAISLIVLQAKGPVFCDGMDFSEALENSGDADKEIRLAVRRFHALLERLTRIPVLVMSLIEGRVNAGGMGLVAASDLVYAKKNADFGLSEILFGLLPATITPFLTRRIGFQATYRMALTAQRMNAERARECGLVDELIEDGNDAIRRLRLRADHLKRDHIARTKSFYADFSGINSETGRQSEEVLASLIHDANTRQNLQAFVQNNKTPWSMQSN